MKEREGCAPPSEACGQSYEFEFEGRVIVRKDAEQELQTLYRLEVELPIISLRELDQGEAEALDSWIKSLEDESLIQAITQRNEEIAGIVDAQGSTGIISS